MSIGSEWLWLNLHGKARLAVVRVCPQSSLEEHIGLVLKVLVIVAQCFGIQGFRVVAVFPQNITVVETYDVVHTHTHTHTHTQ